MKKSLVALAILAATSVAFAHGVTAQATGGNTVVSGSTASVTSNGTGSATASVGNIGYARTEVATSGAATGGITSSVVGGKLTVVDTRAGNVGVSGVTETYNRTDVVTTTTGGASAFGAAGGVAAAGAAGAGAFHTTITGPAGAVTDITGFQNTGVEST